MSCHVGPRPMFDHVVLLGAICWGHLEPIVGQERRVLLGFDFEDLEEHAFFGS